MADPTRIFAVAMTLLVCQMTPGKAAAADLVAGPQDAEILAELFEPTMIEFRDVPLTDALEFLKDLHGVPMGLDEAAVKAAKIDRQIPLTYKSPVVNRRSTFPLYRALWEMLGGANVSFMIKDHKLLVTTAKAAEEWQREFVKSVESQRR